MAVWWVTSSSQFESLYPGSGAGRPLLLVLSPWITGVAGVAAGLLPVRRGRRTRLLHSLVLAAAGVLVLTALYLFFVEPVGYGRRGASEAFVISWQQAEECGCGGVDASDCIAGLELDHAAVAECWGRNRVGLIRWGLTVGYLLTLVGLGGAAGLAAPAAAPGDRPARQAGERLRADLRVFLSYRRGDSATISGRIYDRLSGAFESVFKDVVSIDLGDDFRKRIAEAISESDVLVVVIGPGWLARSGPDAGTRLDDPDDVVRYEVERALAADLPIVPVLVGGGQVPSAEDLPDSLLALTRRNAARLRDDPDFDSDVERLLEGIRRLVRRDRLRR